VNQEFNLQLPCDSGTDAAGAPDAAHSGPLRGGVTDKAVAFTTRSLSTDLTFAVCYAETLGTTLAQWSDSGIRLKISKVSIISYGDGITNNVPTNLVPVRGMPSSNPATNRLGNTANLQLTYAGDLEPNRWVSFVDSTLNSNNPCTSSNMASSQGQPGTSAAAAASASCSGPMQASYSTKRFVLPQSTTLQGNMLFAVCYTDFMQGSQNSLWYDSNIRFEATRLTSIASYQFATPQLVVRLLAHGLIVAYESSSPKSRASHMVTLRE